MKFTVQAHAKINWSLGVLGRRTDGYHDLDMLMQPLALSDELVFESSRWLSLSVDGAPAPSGEKNLVLRAASLLCDATGKQRGARITLVKRIPTRAGLGGGSADCAATLLALNRLWNLKLSMRSLLALGARLGADVPFCLSGGLAHVGGLGEKITALPGAPSIPLAMVTPGGGLSTPAVFREFDDGGDPFGALDASALAAALCAGDLDRAQSLSLNSLEPAGHPSDAGDRRGDAPLPRAGRALRAHDRQRFHGLRGLRNPRAGGARRRAGGRRDCNLFSGRRPKLTPQNNNTQKERFTWENWFTEFITLP